MTIRAMNTHGGLANQRDSPVALSANAVANAPKTPSITMGRKGEKYTPHKASSCGIGHLRFFPVRKALPRLTGEKRPFA